MGIVREARKASSLQFDISSRWGTTKFPAERALLVSVANSEKKERKEDTKSTQMKHCLPRLRNHPPAQSKEEILWFTDFGRSGGWEE